MKIFLALLTWLLLATSAFAQNPTCPTRATGDNTNACASTAFVHQGFEPVLPSFIANLPLIGNGTNVPTQGTRSGSTTNFGTVTGTPINGNCASWNSGNLADAGAPCGSGGGGSGTVTAGTVGQFAYYPANGTTVAGTNLPLPILNASGSQATSTGTISATSTSLSITAAGDWVNGEGIMIPGAGPTVTVTAPTGLSVTPHGTTGSTSYAYKIVAVDASGGVSAASSSTSISTGNATLSGQNYNLVSWSAVAGSSGYIIYGRSGGTFSIIGVTQSGNTTFFDTGGAWTPSSLLGGANPPWIPLSAPSAALNDYLVTTVSSGGGTTTLTLAHASTNAATAVTVTHDDTAAIQAAINALPTRGGSVALSCVIYNISSPIAIGNGLNGSTPSTVAGISLDGCGNSMGAYWFGNTPGGTEFSWQGNVNSPMVSVAGPIYGWNIHNILFHCNDTGYIGEQIVAGSLSEHRSVAFVTCLYGILTSTFASGSSTPGNQGGVWLNTAIMGRDNGQWIGIRLGGVSTSDTYAQTFTSTQITDHFPDSTSGQGIVLSAVDTVAFTGTQISYATGGSLIFDYTVNNTWPAGVMFFSIDPGAYGFANVGTPVGGAALNIIYGLGTANGGTCTALANLSCHTN